MENDNKYSSRKFLLTAFAVLSPIILLVTHHLDAAVYADITKWVIGLYFTGNVVEKIGLVPKA